MRKKLHTLLALSLLSAATLVVSCNKDNKDPDFGGSSGGGATINTIGKEQPSDKTALYYYNENSGTLYKRAGNSWKVLGSLVGFKNGNSVYSNSKAPVPSFGKDKDYFVNSTNDKVYQKRGGAWHEITIDDEIVIRDPNFKAALLSSANNNAGSVDTNGNGKISSAEAKAVQALRVSSANISSLDGIEHFSSLIVLEAKGNKLTEVYLEKLTELKQLDLTGNQLKGTVDLSKLTKLQNGKVSIVKNGSNPQIEKIIVSDVAKATALNNSERTNKYTATGEVDQIIDLDPVVKSAIVAESTGPDRNGDGEITISEALAYTGRIDIGIAGVRSLKGLEQFKNISALRIYPGDNNTNTLDANNTKLSLTAFPNMKTLDISNTTLEELEIKNFPKLTRISVVNGNLKNISIVEATELQELSLERNSLTALSATFFNGLTKLTAINLLGNNIAGEINLAPVQRLEANAGNIQIMRECRLCSPKRGNLQVTNIYVNTQNEASVLNGADGTVVYKSNSGGGSQDNTKVTITDRNLKSQILRILRNKDFATYGNRTVDQDFTQSDVDKITELLIDTNITNITGLERFTKLKKLELFPQGPTTLDLTAMQELEEITLGGTMKTITGSNVSLKKVTLKENRNVTKLDLRGFRNIEKVFIEEQPTTPNHIECIAVPANKVEDVKASINITGTSNADLARTKTTLYRSKVQLTPCN